MYSHAFILGYMDKTAGEPSIEELIEVPNTEKLRRSVNPLERAWARATRTVPDVLPTIRKHRESLGNAMSTLSWPAFFANHGARGVEYAYNKLQPFIQSKITYPEAIVPAPSKLEVWLERRRLEGKKTPGAGLLNRLNTFGAGFLNYPMNTLLIHPALKLMQRDWDRKAVPHPYDYDMLINRPADKLSPRERRKRSIFESQRLLNTGQYDPIALQRLDPSGFKYRPDLNTRIRGLNLDESEIVNYPDPKNALQRLKEGSRLAKAGVPANKMYPYSSLYYKENPK